MVAWCAKEEDILCPASFLTFKLKNKLKGQKETRLHVSGNLGLDMKCLTDTGKGSPRDGAKLLNLKSFLKTFSKS